MVHCSVNENYHCRKVILNLKRCLHIDLVLLRRLSLPNTCQFMIITVNGHHKVHLFLDVGKQTSISHEGHHDIGGRASIHTHSNDTEDMTAECECAGRSESGWSKTGVKIQKKKLSNYKYCIPSINLNLLMGDKMPGYEIMY